MPVEACCLVLQLVRNLNNDLVPNVGLKGRTGPLAINAWTHRVLDVSHQRLREELAESNRRGMRTNQ